MFDLIRLVALRRSSARSQRPCPAGERPRPGRRLRGPFTRPVVGSVLGSALCLLAGWSALGAAPWSAAPRRVTGWILADRGADRLLELDRDLRVLGWQAASEPLRVATRAAVLAGAGAPEGPDGWWIEGLAGAPLGPHRLHAFRLPLPQAGQAPLTQAVSAGPAGGEWPFLRDLAVDAQGAALVLAGPLTESEARLWKVRQGQAPVELAVLNGALRIALGDNDVWAGGEQGRLWRLSTDGEILASAQLGTEVHALAVRGSDLWCLDATGVLRRLDADFELQWSADLGFTPGPLAVDRKGSAWVAAEGQPFVQAVDALGHLLDPVTEVGGDAWTAVNADGPGPLGAAPGYVLQLDLQGGSLASQGGFGYLSDLAPRYAGSDGS
jgi:hypothetical protein